VVPATEELVWEMLGTFGKDPTQSLGVIQPRNAPVTLEKIAFNAVMAGCRPEHFPVVVAAVRAILQPAFNVAGCQATTGGAAPVIIVNGPLATQLSINGDAGCFGPGSPANGGAGREVLQTLVESIKTVAFANYYQIGPGAQLTLVVCPEHAAEMAAAGLTKADVRAYIFQEARMPMRRLKGIAHYGNRNWPAWIDEDDPEALVPVVRCADDVVVVVAGGDGRHSAWLAGWGVTRVVTEEITTPS